MVFKSDQPFTFISADNLCKAAYTHDTPWWYQDDLSLNGSERYRNRAVQACTGHTFCTSNSCGHTKGSVPLKLLYDCAQAPYCFVATTATKLGGRTPVPRNGCGGAGHRCCSILFHARMHGMGQTFTYPPLARWTILSAPRELLFEFA